MRVNVISNVDNGAGLENDCGIVQGVLAQRGHDVTKTHFKSLPPRDGDGFDVNIFLETPVPQMMRFARKNVFLPNLDYYFHDWQGHIVRRMDAILCKTKHAREVLTQHFEPSKVRYVGFTSRDHFDPAVPRERRFCHVAGKSPHKGTLAILEAWQRHGLPFPLTVFCSCPDFNLSGAALSQYTALHLSRQTPEAIKWEQNRSLFHLCPSQYEGFGHGLHEARSCGGIIATTDAPPMNEWGIPYLIAPSSRQKRGLIELANVDADGVLKAAVAMMELPLRQIADCQREARQSWLREREQFEAWLLEEVEAAR